MIISEAEARERLNKSPLRYFNARFNPTETAPGAGLVPMQPDTNLQSMLEASLTKTEENESA